MPNIRFYLDPSKVDKNGFSPIKANIAINNKNHWRTIEKAKSRHWNGLKQRISPNRETEPYNRHIEINKLLDDYDSKSKALFNNAKKEGIPITENIVVDFLNGKDFSKKEVYYLNEIFSEFLKVTKTTKSIATLKNRTTVYKFLCDYQVHAKSKITLHEINPVFFDKLTDYAFNERKIRNNYFAKIVAVLKTFLNWAAEREYYTGTKHRKFKAPEKDLEVIFLSVDEFMKLRSFKFENPKLDRVRDIYCLGCLTGLRFSDLMDLKREHIRDGEIHKTILKTEKTVTIPLLPWAKAIIEKYTHPVRVLPRISNQKFNDYINDCCKAAGINQPTSITHYSGNNKEEITQPKYEFITAHTARKTFVTLSFFLGMDVKTIKKITGHTSDKSFDKYLKIADEMKKQQLFDAWGKLEEKPEPVKKVRSRAGSRRTGTRKQ
jgi:integrase